MTVHETLSCGRIVRLATAADLPAIVRLMADDALGTGREELADPLPSRYTAAFAAIDADPRNELIVVTEPDGAIVATLQLTFIPGISHQGSERALVEAVRVATHLRGQGLGHRLMEWVANRARQHGCRLVQLTSNKTRTDAHRFYESLGFVRSHDGFKLHL